MNLERKNKFLTSFVVFVLFTCNVFCMWSYWKKDSDLQELIIENNELSIAVNNLTVQINTLYRDLNESRDVLGQKTPTKIKKMVLNNTSNSTHIEYLRYLSVFEGIYSNDPSDVGGETVYGIARKYNSKHEIWDYIDEIRKNLEQKNIFTVSEMKKQIQSNEKILSIAHKNYIRQWCTFELDEYPFEFACSFLDMVINCGENRTVESLQIILNGFNYKNRFGDDLTVDGLFQKKTKQSLKKAIKLGFTPYIVNSLQSFRVHRYIALAGENPKQRKFVRGWLNRALFNYKGEI